MVENNPQTVSVVIPAHNAEKTVGICLSSIYNGTVRPDEVIVVDDNSSDNTAAVAQQLGAKVFQLKGCSYGPGYCRNLGAHKASGDVIAFLDSDTKPAKDWLASIKEEMTPDIDGIGGRYVLDLENSEHKWFNRVFMLWEESLWSHFKSKETCNHLTGGNCAYRNEAWHAATRTYEETRLFKGIASGEDYFVSEEISLTHTLKYSDKIVVTHMTDYYPRFFRRSVNQGFSRLSNMLYHYVGKGRKRSGGHVKLNQGVVKASGMGRFTFAYLCFFSCLAILVLQQYLLAGLSAAVGAAFFLYGMQPFFTEIRSAGLQKKAYVTAILITLLQQSGWGTGIIKALLHPFKMKTADFLQLLAAFWRFRVSAEIAKMFFFVTSKCNSGCPWCLNNPRKKKEAPGHPPQELSLEQIGRMCERSNISLPYVVITGGEPFLRNDIDQIAFMLCHNLNTKYITIATNGSRPGVIEEQLERILISCPLLRINVQMTVADLNEKHNRIRHHKGSYQSLIDSAGRIHTLKKRFPNLMFSISTQLSNDNLIRYKEIIDGVKADFNPDSHFVSPIRKVPALVSPPDESLDYFSDMVTYSQNRSIEGKKSGLFQAVYAAAINASWDVYKAIRLGKYRYHPCVAARKFISLFEDGRVTACENRMDFFLGSLQDNGYRLDAILLNEKTHNVLKRIRDTRCQCDWICGITHNLMYSPKFIVGVSGQVLKNAVKQTLTKRPQNQGEISMR